MDILITDVGKWGSFFKKARKGKMTQTEVADKMATVRMVVYHLEVKQRSTLTTLFRYCRVLGLSVDIKPGNPIMSEVRLNRENAGTIARIARRLQELTVEDVATELGVTSQTINNLEQGANIKADTAFKLYDFLNLNLILTYEKDDTRTAKPDLGISLDNIHGRLNADDGHGTRSKPNQDDDNLGDGGDGAVDNLLDNQEFTPEAGDGKRL